MAFRYRMAEPSDLPLVRELWRASTEWGDVTDFMWRRYVEEPPFGGVTLALAEDEGGRIVGSFAFLPQVTAIDGREVRSCRPLAPIVSDAARGRLLNPMNHPVLGMYLHAVRTIKDRGDALIYMVPDPRWVRLFRIFPWFKVGSFPLWSLPLPLGAPLPLGDGHRAVDVDPTDPRIDDLWRATQTQYRAAVIRDRRTLPWKIWSGEYRIVGVERGDALVGLAASRQKGARQWLLCDLLAADTGPALRATLAATANLADAEARANPDARIAKLAVLLPNAMTDAARALGFVRDAYDFPMVVHLLDESLPVEAVAPGAWYVSAND